MHEILPDTEDGFVALRVSEKLEQSDYDQIIPVLEGLIERNGKISLYWEMRDFDGWTIEAFFSDGKFDAKHTDDFKRIAMVGEKKWHDWMTKLMKPFTSAEVQFFDLNDSAQALTWAKA